MADENQHYESTASCRCFAAPLSQLTGARELGLDKRFAEVSILVCGDCGQHWLRYFYEVEAFTSSGRWYLGPVTPEQAAGLTAEDAKGTLEGLSWYYYGGSFYRGRGGQASGKIF